MATTTTDRDALLAAVLAAPDDDAPRLVYADWLDDHGEPDRAEFIRVQCELARLGPPPVVVTESCVLTRRYGPGYFTLSGGEETKGGGRLIMEIKVGSRVDVLKPRGKKPMHGLRVHKIGSFNTPDADSEVVVVKDAESKPWAGEALRRRERELLGTHHADWLMPSPTPFPLVIKWKDGRQIGWGLREVTRLGDDYIPVEFSRGFVGAVTCSLATWVGGPCEACGGSGYWQETTGLPNRSARGPYCHSCLGTGRTPGLGPAVAAAHPVTDVRLTDREPHRNGYGYGWFNSDRPRPSAAVPGSAVLPPHLWHALPSTGNGKIVDGRFKAYPTRDAARAALSAALVAWARGQT